MDTGELLYEADVKGECSILSALGEDVAAMSSDGQIWIFDSNTGLEKSYFKLTCTQGSTVASVLSLPRHEKLLIASQECLLNLVRFYLNTLSHCIFFALLKSKENSYF